MALSKKKNFETMAINQQEPTPDTLNQINAGTEITGEINSSGNFHFNGKLKGTMNIKGKLVVGNTGFIDGDVICTNCDVLGKIQGKLNVSEQLSLKSSAVIEGEVLVKKLAIEPGAVFNVTSKMNDGKSTGQPSFQQTDKKDNKVNVK